MDSMYKALVHPEIPIDNNYKIWQMKIPLKINVLAWYKRNWQGSKKCVSCAHDETIKHLFSLVKLHGLFGQLSKWL